jgi:hypothetical protein
MPLSVLSSHAIVANVGRVGRGGSVIPLAEFDW